MNHRHVQIYFFLALFITSLILLFFVFRPFIPLAIFAGILALLMRPVFNWLVKYFRGARGFAAFSTVILTLLIILTPLAFLVVSLSIEAAQLFGRLRTEVDFSQIESNLRMLIGPEQASQLTERLTQAVADIASFVQPFISSISSNVFAIFSNTVEVVFGLIIMLFAMYYVLKDGRDLKKELLDLSPLNNKDDEKLFKRINDAVIAVAYGEFVVSLLKGVIGGIVFLLLGLPAPVFWGTVIALANLVPAIGTALVTVPFAIYLFATGQVVTGIIFTVAAVLVIGLVDNFITPQLIRSRIHIHPLLILFSILGGILFFGPVGLFFGPIILSVTMALLDIYKDEFRTRVKRL